MVRVKYCVFTFPLVVTAVQTHGGASSALRSIHAPTRNEEGTYIRASVASDVATLSTPKTQSHQVTTMNIFLLGGWVARPSAFLFCSFPVFALSSVFALLFVVAFLGSRLNLTTLCSSCLVLPHCSNWLPCLTVSNLIALCRLCLFLVCLAFPHCLALILH